MSFIGVSLLAAMLLAMLVCDYFGLHRQDVLYLSSTVYFLILPAIVIAVAIVSALVRIRYAASAHDGKDLVLRKLEPARWAVILALRAVGFGLAIAAGAYYSIGMAVSYTSRTPIQLDNVPARLWAPNLLARTCRLFVVVSVSPTSDSYVCLDHAVGISHARLSSIDGPNEGQATIHGRRGFLGAVADTISIHVSAGPE
jgi:hypothetical protein